MRSKNPQISVKPSEDSFLVWHFVLHSLPADTPYHEGCYHGKVVFPPQYPHAPPSIYMVTPSGRLEVGKKLCLSMTDFHPESWNPAWSTETILVGLLSFFISEKEKGYGSILDPEPKRRQLAAESWASNAKDMDFQSLFPEFLRTEPQSEGGESPVHEKEPQSLEGKTEPPAPTEVLEPSAVEETLEPTPACPPTYVAEGGEGQPGGPQADEEEEPPECWICRDITSEPLIQPCACRGSMSYVHASCVEQWIQHHRRNTVNDQRPRCSVCHQEYHGEESHPGMSLFVRHLCHGVFANLLRVMLMALLLVGFEVATSGQGLLLPIRILLISVFAVAYIRKLILLTVSLPPHRPPPESACLRFFFVEDPRQLAMHLAEVSAAVVTLLIGFAAGMIPWQFFLPFAILSMIPLVRCKISAPSWACARAVLMLFGGIILSPFLVIWVVVQHLRRTRVLDHLLGATPHIVVALAVVPICIWCANNIPLVAVWGAHGLLAVLGTIERACVKKLRWQQNRGWLVAMYLVVMDTYFANTCEFTKGIGEDDAQEGPSQTSSLVVLLSSLAWLLLVGGFVVSINWEQLVGYYRRWQRQNGQFTLQVNGAAVAGVEGGGEPLARRVQGLSEV